MAEWWWLLDSNTQTWWPGGVVLSHNTSTVIHCPIKISWWVSFAFLYGYGAPLGSPKGALLLTPLICAQICFINTKTTFIPRKECSRVTFACVLIFKIIKRQTVPSFDIHRLQMYFHFCQNNICCHKTTIIYTFGQSFFNLFFSTVLGLFKKKKMFHLWVWQSQITVAVKWSS